MRFLDFVSNALNEMPYNQSKGLEKIEDQTLQLTRHILKVWLMPKSRDFNHWITEIRNYLDLMDLGANVKTKRGRISHNALTKEYKNTVTEQRIKNALSYINSSYGEKFKYDVKYYNSVKKFYDFLWLKLAEFDFSTDEIIEYIEGVEL